MDFLDLVLEEIFLVEEEHDGGEGEEPVVTDAVEEMERLVHAVLRRGGEKWTSENRSVKKESTMDTSVTPMRNSAGWQGTDYFQDVFLVSYFPC